MFLARSKAAVVHPRSFQKGWLVVWLCAGISSFTTVTLAESKGEVDKREHYLASTQYLYTGGIDEHVESQPLKDSIERVRRPVSGSFIAQPTIYLSAPEKAFVQDISIRVLREAYDKLGYKLVVQKLPNLRSLMSANDGKYDGEVSRVANLNSSYPNLLPVPTEINVVNVVALGQQDSVNVRKIESIRDDPLCVRGNVIVETLISEYRIECVFVININQALAMVKMGRARYALLPETNARISVLHLPASNIRVVSPVLHSEALYHYLHKKNRSLVEPLDKILREMRSSGEIEQIRSDYFDSIPSQAGIGLDDHRK